MKILTIFVVLCLAVVTYSEQPENSIRNFYRIDKTFCTGGQAKVDELVALKNSGVKAIINLRPANEFDATEEAAKAKELGLRYYNIQVAFMSPKEEQVTEFLKLTDDPNNRPVFIHCTAGIRAAAFWMI